MPVVGAENTRIRFKVKQTLPAYDTLTIVVRKPSGTILNLPASLVTDTDGQYIEATIPVLDESGYWCAHVQLDGPDWSGPCKASTFYVESVC